MRFILISDDDLFSDLQRLCGERIKRSTKNITMSDIAPEMMRARLRVTKEEGDAKGRNS